MKLFSYILIPILTSLSLSNFNNLNVKKEQNNEDLEGFYFETNEIYILKENYFTESNVDEVPFEEVSFTFSYYSSSDIDVSNFKINATSDLDYLDYIEISEISVSIDTPSSFSFSVKGLKENENNPITLKISYLDEVSEDISVYILDSYFDDDKSFTKYLPSSISEDNETQFTYQLIDGSDIVNIDQGDINFRIIENENNVIEISDELDFPITLPYGVNIKTTSNTGKAIIRCEYVPSENKNLVVKYFDINIIVINGNEYFYIYYCDGDISEPSINDLELVNLNIPFSLEPYSLYTFYIGNTNSEQFDPSEILITPLDNKESKASLIKSLYYKSVTIENIPFLKASFITSTPSLDSETIKISISTKTNSNINKNLEINVIKGDFNINLSVDSPIKFYPTPYSILEIPTNLDFKKNLDIFITDKNGHVLDLPDFDIYTESGTTEINYLLGKQRLYVYFPSVNKLTSFDVKLSMNPSLTTQDRELPLDMMTSLYKNLLERAVTNNLPSYYEVSDVYDDLEYEYVNSLTNEAKENLLRDTEFVRMYIRFILENEINTSFFKGINVNFGISRYALPIVIGVGIGVLFFITLGVGLYYVYKRKGNEEDE